MQVDKNCFIVTIVNMVFFKRQNLLDEHLKRGCLAVDGQGIKLPDKGSIIEFKNHDNKFKCPFVIYGDFECLTTKTGCYSKPVDSNEQDPTTSFTKKYQNTCLLVISLLLLMINKTL